MMVFKNRIDAANQLAHKLHRYQNKNGVVLAIPRGGVPLGAVIANQLNMPLDILLSKKIGHPFNKEYAIGAVTLYGYSIDEDCNDVSEDYIQQEVSKITKSLHERQNKFRGNKPAPDLAGKLVFIVDDGIATGQTILAGIKNLRNQHPKKIIVAVPVAPNDTARRMEGLVDEFVCLFKADLFHGIGEFYSDFSQVSDEEVEAILKDH